MDGVVPSAPPVLVVSKREKGGRTCDEGTSVESLMIWAASGVGAGEALGGAFEARTDDQEVVSEASAVLLSRWAWIDCAWASVARRLSAITPARRVSYDRLLAASCSSSAFFLAASRSS